MNLSASETKFVLEILAGHATPRAHRNTMQNIYTPFSTIKCLFSKIRPLLHAIQHRGTAVAAISRAFGFFSSTMESMTYLRTAASVARAPGNERRP